MSNKQMLVDAAMKFIKKVDTGRARSKETYRELTEALNAPEDIDAGSLGLEGQEFMDGVESVLRSPDVKITKP